MNDETDIVATLLRRAQDGDEASSSLAARLGLGNLARAERFCALHNR